MKIYDSIEQLIGNTPLLKLKGYEKAVGCKGNILAKLECFNPAGSAKDRAAKYMLDGATEKGLLNSETVVIEPTSGNTGIALAAICSSRGIRTILTMPESMSVERRRLLAAYGAEIILTPANLGMQGAVAEAERLHSEIENSIIAGQFYNPDNPKAHYYTTGPEIWQDCERKIDILVAGIGTGGTISGTGKYLKEMDQNIKVFGVEPESSPLISKGVASSHKIQGIGANFIPENFYKDICDGVITISDDDAINAMKTVAKTDGVLVGISSGAALFGAKKILDLPENKGKTVVVILPDTGERYLSAVE